MTFVGRVSGPSGCGVRVKRSIVDDDDGIRQSAVMALQRAGHRTLEAADANSALGLLHETRVDVVVSDIYMPGQDGLALLQSIGERANPPHVILMTARGTIETAALAARIGAFDYLAKPFELSELIDCVRAASSKAQPKGEEPDAAPPSRIIGSHRSMVEMYQAISRIASLSRETLNASFALGELIRL